MSTVRYHIRHRTAYTYSGRIDLYHSLAHLRPREDEGQETLAHRIEVVPEPKLRSERRDCFGNLVNYFSIEQSHDFLEVIATTTVLRPDLPAVLPDSGIAWDALRVDGKEKDASGVRLGNYLLPTPAFPPSPRSRPSSRLRCAGTRDDGSRQRSDAADLHRVPLRARRDQHGNTARDGDEAEDGGLSGFRHVMIAALRSVGIPVRYVSGYLETLPPPGKQKLQGADASHAWVEVWTPATGWVGFDPTNNIIPAARHIKISHGRDYFDVQPLKGIFLGTGTQSLLVQVDVERM